MTRRHFVAAGSGAFLGHTIKADTRPLPISSLVSRGDRLLALTSEGVLPGFEPSWRPFSATLAGANQLLVAGGLPGKEGRVSLVDLNQGTLKSAAKIGTDVVYEVAFHEPSNTVAIACHDAHVRAFSLDNWEPSSWRTRHQHTGTARTVTFLKDGTLISGGLDGAVIVSPSDAEEALTLTDHTAGVECLAASPDGTLIASGARDSRVRLHASEGRLVRTYSGIGLEEEPVVGRLPARILSLLWLNDHLIAGTSNGGVYQLDEDSSDWKRVKKLSPPEPVSALAWHQDRLAVGSASVTFVSL